MTFRRWFTEHPRSIGESYLEHAAHAASFGVAMLRGSFACFVHAAVPALCTTTGSRAVARLHDRMIVSRDRLRMIAPTDRNPAEFIAEHI